MRAAGAREALPRVGAPQRVRHRDQSGGTGAGEADGVGAGAGKRAA